FEDRPAPPKSEWLVEAGWLNEHLKDRVIIADHYLSDREDLRIYRNTFLDRIKQRYPNRQWLLPPVLETILKIEGLSDAEFLELMETFRSV
ncbi:MAG: hypothetical protein ACRD2L_23395, partial [Terriglobia bacterium]